MKYEVFAVGGKEDGKTIARFNREVDAINYAIDHSDDYPLGCGIVDQNGKLIETW